VNGMAAHGGLIPYGSTFFTFSDYCKSALRMAAIMHTQSLFIFTHDSIALGEDGPTHQPIEHLMMLRAVPFLTDFRPADANETSAVWRLALERKSPSFMALSRQDLPVFDPATHNIYEGVKHGAYIVEQGGDSPDVLIVATGAEVWTVLDAAAALKKEGVTVRVVSMPSWKIFEELAVEGGSPIGWWKYVGRHGDVIGLERFGASSPGKIALEKLGYSVGNIASRAKALVEKARKSEAALAGK
jgi:transketolase